MSHLQKRISHGYAGFELSQVALPVLIPALAPAVILVPDSSLALDLVSKQEFLPG